MAKPSHVVSRSTCGLAPPNLARLHVRAPGKLVGVTIHHTATGGAFPIPTWCTIQREYMSGQNVNHEVYGDTPYNDGISGDGRIFVGRDHRFVGAHASSTNGVANELTLGVAYIGDGAHLTDAAKHTLRVYLVFATAELGRRPLLFKHSDWSAAGGIATACPGGGLAAFVDQLRREARAGKPWL